MREGNGFVYPKEGGPSTDLVREDDWDTNPPGQRKEPPLLPYERTKQEGLLPPTPPPWLGLV